ncbi:MAG: hypothetical protein GF347_01850 [Candidatus Moranbacteria bacterium]|nr:hypothetical protein [Candidatus Moranbacteria bacterium]
MKFTIYKKISLFTIFVFSLLSTPKLKVGAVDMPVTDLPDPGGSDPIVAVVSNVLSFIMTVAGFLSVLAFIISGIMYVTASGNEDQMQTAKRALIYGIIGVAITLLSLSIIMLINDIMQDNIPTL